MSRLLAGLCCATAVWAQNGVIRTVAGGGPPDGAPASGIVLASAGQMAIDRAGSLYVPSLTRHRVFKVTADGVIETVAGGGEHVRPWAVALDAAGDLYFADWNNNTIRKVAGGVMTTVAGNGTRGYSGDGGPATAAQLGPVMGLAFDAAGSLYLSDWSNSAIRRVSGGIITTVAGNGKAGFSGDGGPAAEARLSSPRGIAFDAGGNLYLSDNGNLRVRKISDGVITTVAGNGLTTYSGDGAAATATGMCPDGIATGAEGIVYVSEGCGSRVLALTNGVVTAVAGNGKSVDVKESGPALSTAIGLPTGVTAGAAGEIFFFDTSTGQVRKVVDGMIQTVAGDAWLGMSAPPTAFQFSDPGGVAVGPGGELYVADTSNNLVFAVIGSDVTPVAGNGGQGGSQVGPATALTVTQPTGLALDVSGALYIAESGNHRIVKVAGGILSRVAGTGSPGDSAGPVELAQLRSPSGVTVSDSGEVYIADTGNHRIRKVANGVVTTVAGTGAQGYLGDGGSPSAAQLFAPRGVALDRNGDLYIADTFNHRIRKISGGVITTIAGNGNAGYAGDGGPAIDAQLFAPRGIAIDSTGSVYVADSASNAIRKIVDGVITTVAGTGFAGFAGDEAQATAATLDFPVSVAVDPFGTLYVADNRNQRIRAVAGARSSGAPLLSIAAVRSGEVTAGTSLHFELVVSNAAAGGPSEGGVRVSEIAPTGLTVTNMAGDGWECEGQTCFRSDVLPAGAVYPPIAVSADVAVDARSAMLNQAMVRGGGSLPASTSDRLAVRR